MREILFRGKRIDNGEWVEGYVLRDTEFYGRTDEHTYIVNHKHPSSCFGSDIYYEVDPSTVGQYICKKDKNRKKIFEGDIVQAIKTEFNPPRKYRKPYQVHYKSDFPSAVEEYYSPFEHFTEKVAYEVIGNIHDNPELLEVDNA